MSTKYSTVSLFVTCVLLARQSNTIDVTQIEDIAKRVDIDQIEDLFKVHLYRNPHPICSLYKEPCVLDNNCCFGLECKLDVDKNGLKYVCLKKIAENETELETQTDEMPVYEEDVKWTIKSPDKSSASSLQDSKDSLEDEVIRQNVERLKQRDESLNKEFNVLKDLNKPLTISEIKELSELKELEDLKRHQELLELQNWNKTKMLEEAYRKRRKKILEKIAKERVQQVLKEEERQKIEMYKRYQEKVASDIVNMPPP